jgi:hypothetical protein
VIPFVDTRFFKKSLRRPPPRSAKLKRESLSSDWALKMFRNTTVENTKTTLQNFVDMVINVGLTALVGASIVAALAIGGAPMSTGDTRAAMPPPEFQSSSTNVSSPPCYEPPMSDKVPAFLSVGATLSLLRVNSDLAVPISCLSGRASRPRASYGRVGETKAYVLDCGQGRVANPTPPQVKPWQRHKGTRRSPLPEAVEEMLV